MIVAMPLRVKGGHVAVMIASLRKLPNAEGLHFSAFHSVRTAAQVNKLVVDKVGVDEIDLMMCGHVRVDMGHVCAIAI